jgi:tetratricopeptide (TPR) repeat protein
MFALESNLLHDYAVTDDSEARRADFSRLGRVLTLLRMRRTMPQAEAARRAGIGKSQLRKYDEGGPPLMAGGIVHPTSEQILEFLCDQLPPQREREVTLHLEACSTCQSWLDETAPGSAQAHYDPVLDRVSARASTLQAEVALERQIGAALWDELEPHPDQRRLLMVDHMSRFRCWGLFDLLLAASADAEPTEALGLAELAWRVARQLPARRYGSLISDYEAAALLAAARAHRLLRQLKPARQLLELAVARCEQGSGEPILEADIVAEEGLLSKDLGDFESAEHLLKTAVRLYRAVGQRSQEGQAHLFLGDLLGVVSPKSGLDHLVRAFELLDFAGARRLELETTHCFLCLLLENGQACRAWDALEDHRPLYRRFNNSQVRIQRLWLEGRILRGMGELREAEDLCRRAQLGLDELGYSRESLRCSLDVAAAAWSAGGTADQARSRETLALGFARLGELGFPAEVKQRWRSLLGARFAQPVHRSVVEGLLRRWSSTRAVASSHLFFF